MLEVPLGNISSSVDVLTKSGGESILSHSFLDSSKLQTGVFAAQPVSKIREETVTQRIVILRYLLNVHFGSLPDAEYTTW